MNDSARAGVLPYQNAELENEKELGNCLLKFGVRVREATELMQRQISSFYDDEPTSVKPATPALRRGNQHVMVGRGTVCYPQ